MASAGRWGGTKSELGSTVNPVTMKWSLAIKLERRGERMILFSLTNKVQLPSIHQVNFLFLFLCFPTLSLSAFIVLDDQHGAVYLCVSSPELFFFFKQM